MTKFSSNLASQEVQAAFEEAEDASELVALIVSLRDAGVGQEELTFELTTYAAKLRESGEEDREDAVLDILDCIVGWCGPQARLFP